MFQKNAKIKKHVFKDTIMQDRGNGEKEYDLKLSFTTSKGLRESLEMPNDGKKNMVRLAKKALFSNDEIAFVDVYLENYQNGNYGWMLIDTDENRYKPTDKYVEETFYYDECYEHGGFNDFKEYDTNSSFVIYTSEVTEHTKLVIALFDPWGVVLKKDIAGILDYKVELTLKGENEEQNQDEEDSDVIKIYDAVNEYDTDDIYGIDDVDDEL